MNITIHDSLSLPALVKKASNQLASAENAAEVLEAKDSASIVYDAAKRAARILKAKGAHDEVIAAVRRSQADALEIEALASRRLADEYDAAQERGEVRTQADNQAFSISEKAGFSDIGFSSPKQIHEARAIRNAEVAEPGIVRRILDEAIEQGEEPTRAKVREAVHVRGTFGTGENEWYTPDEHLEAARYVLGEFDLDPASSNLAQDRVRASQFCTKENSGLEHEWGGRVWLNPPYAQPHIAEFVSKMVKERSDGRVSEAIMLTHNYTDTTWFHHAASVASATSIYALKAGNRINGDRRHLMTYIGTSFIGPI